MSLRIKFRHRPAIRIFREAIKTRKLVYIARANKKIRYPYGKSSIVYVGMTKVGARRVAASAASKGAEILDGYGFKYLEFYLVTNQKLPGVASWEMLEKAIALRFRETYGKVPLFNNSFSKARWGKEKNYFKMNQLDNVIKSFEAAV